LLARRLIAHERIKLDWQASGIAVNPLKVRSDETGHFNLAIFGDIDDCAKMIDEQVDAIRGELFLQQRPLRAHLPNEVVQS
jgi:hypothetical protein